MFLHVGGVWRVYSGIICSDLSDVFSVVACTVTLPCVAPRVAQVIDFGLSNTCDGGRLLKTACGSPCYAAPEMIAGHKYVGSATDMWSLGVVLFALVCGYLPFEHENTAKLYQKILNGDYTTPEFISSQVPFVALRGSVLTLVIDACCCEV